MSVFVCGLLLALRFERENTRAGLFRSSSLNESLNLETIGTKGE